MVKVLKVKMKKRFVVFTWGERPLIVQTKLPSCVIAGYVANNTFQKYPKPFKLVKQTSTSTVGYQSMRILQRPLEKRTGVWYVVIAPNVAVPDDFWDILEAECTNDATLYGAEKIDYACPTDLVNGIPVIQVFEKMSEIGLGHLQVYCNAAMQGPTNKVIDCSDVMFRQRFASVVSLPMYVSYISQCM